MSYFDISYICFVGKEPPVFGWQGISALDDRRRYLRYSDDRSRYFQYPDDMSRYLLHPDDGRGYLLDLLCQQALLPLLQQHNAISPKLVQRPPGNGAKPVAFLFASSRLIN
jgi:hypothetical protein